jgi:hypothetical protein
MDGSGFVFDWCGQPSLLIGHDNNAGELIQVSSQSLMVAIPWCVFSDRCQLITYTSSTVFRSLKGTTFIVLQQFHHWNTTSRSS